MPAERSHRIEQLFHAAPQRHTAERAAFLERACAGDDSLRLEVESLLAEDDGVQSFLETPALEVARNMSDQNSGQSMIGRQFGPYSVVELLAKGGMGEVYRALDTRLGRAVAIKISAEEFSKRFEREARVISALNHPHICTLHDIGSLPSAASGDPDRRPRQRRRQVAGHPFEARACRNPVQRQAVDLDRRSAIPVPERSGRSRRANHRLCRCLNHHARQS